MNQLKHLGSPEALQSSLRYKQTLKFLSVYMYKLKGIHGERCVKHYACQSSQLQFNKLYIYLFISEIGSSGGSS